MMTRKNYIYVDIILYFSILPDIFYCNFSYIFQIYLIGEFTFFAPTNGAFEQIFKEESFLMKNHKFRTELLIRHFVRAKLTRKVYSLLPTNSTALLTSADQSKIDWSYSLENNSESGNILYSLLNSLILFRRI